MIGYIESSMNYIRLKRKACCIHPQKSLECVGRLQTAATIHYMMQCGLLTMEEAVSLLRALFGEEEEQR